MDYPSEIKAKLEAAVQDTVSGRRRYAHSPADFSRNRKLTAEETIFAAMVMSNFCSRIVKKAVVRQDKRNKYQYAVNMKMAINLCRQFFRARLADGEKLLEEIARYVVPIRPGRSNTRNLQPKGFAGFLYRVAA